MPDTTAAASIATHLLKLDFGAPTPILIAIVVIVLGLLLLRFIIKGAITLIKIAVLVAIGVAVYMGIVWLQGQF